MSAEHAHDEHGHGHGHGSRFIQHHYDDAQHQFDSGKLGIWLFLAQEVLFFSALFVAYVLYRYHHPEIYGYAHKYLDVKYGAINTAVLIFSSLTAAWAVRAAQLRQKALLIGCIVLTIACACGFLVIKYIEYSHKYHEQLLFGKYFDPCVSAAGGPLVTKKNECPGRETSVWWENNQPQIGCLPVIDIDQDPRTGLQLSCTVVEAEIAPKKVPKQKEKKDAKGETVKGPDGKPEMEAVKKPNGEPELETATDKHRRWIFDQKGARPVKQCPAPKPGEHAAHQANPDGCWLASSQPAVCRPGFFYYESCEAGAACEASWPATHKLAGKAPGEPVYLAPEISARWGSQADCEQARIDRSQALKKQREEDEKAGKPKPGLTVSQQCVRSDTVGFVIDFGDHDMRTSKRPVVTCAPPPKRVEPADIFADVKPQPRIGEKAVGTAEDHHDAHAAMYAGPPPENTNMFFTIYFAMTGLHGIHVLVGVIVFIWLLIRAVKGHFTPDYFGPVDFAALYWHIVDLIWIFLFPLLYLIH